MGKSWYVGIDPGKSGAMAVIRKDKATDIYDFDLDLYIEILKDIKEVSNIIPIYLGVEKVHSMPNQGVSSTFTFGQRLGEIEGVLKAIGFKYELIPPQVWQKSCGIPPKSDKKAIANIISSYFPLANLNGPRGGLKDGRSDALGIAYYLKQKYKEDING
ncbi:MULTISPECIES: hypothetical protein [Campylobacter]|uniref:Uncharacterized protein n=1 Tax=Campylobacter vicugnae TaxID=1660076 RepID=A0ABZ2E6I6_9BACT|nr:MULTISPECIES: hypothetical protein [unclassified Campylobacter]MCR8701003.1 hypothetical protein [Campylobacter sp. RM12176]